MNVISFFSDHGYNLFHCVTPPTDASLRSEFPSADGHLYKVSLERGQQGLGMSIYSNKSGRGVMVTSVVANGVADGTRKIKEGDEIVKVTAAVLGRLFCETTALLSSLLDLFPSSSFPFLFHPPFSYSPLSFPSPSPSPSPSGKQHCHTGNDRERGGPHTQRGSPDYQPRHPKVQNNRA